MTEFIGVDGEGITAPDESHDYVLLSVGDQSLHRDGARLTFDDIMRFLYRQFQLHNRAAFVGYYLSYDFSQWLREIPEDKAWMLLSPEGVKLRQRKGPNPDPWPVRWSGWEFDVLGMRRFKLRPAMLSHETVNVYQWMWVCDAGPFWQTSFINAIDPKNWDSNPICTDEEYRIIVEGKRKRTVAKFDESMILYNVTENAVLAKAMSRLDEGFRSQKWRLSKKQWFGPGQVADLWLRQISAPTREQIEESTDKVVLDAGRKAYYGGWFEIPRHGHVGTCWEYDINSAYPFVIGGLPCLLHGRWDSRDMDSGEPFTESRAAWRLCYIDAYGNDPYLGGLPHRDDKGIITRPHYTRGWYWAHEIGAALRVGLLSNVTVFSERVWRVHGCECVSPFSSIHKLYEHRLRMGKDTPSGKAIKLVYNSAYGKFAQSVGHPRYANSLYASLITAGCRVMILDAIASHPNGSADVVMIATDGIYFRTRHHGLELSSSVLGLWSESRKDNLTLFMPGVYWDDKTRESIESDRVRIKSRGINADALARCIGQIDNAFTRGYERSGWPSISVPVQFSVITPKLAQARGKWDQCGNVLVYDESIPERRYFKSLSSNPINKRMPVPYMRDGLLTTHPYADKGESVGYSKSFGADIQMLLDNDDMVTDDGTVNLELVEALKGGT